jgi:hypothetical protein
VGDGHCFLCPRLLAVADVPLWWAANLPFSCFSLFWLLLLICVCERRNTTDWVLAQHIFDSLLPYSLDPA